MTAETLQDALSGIREDYILDAHGGPAVRRNPWLRWGALAACMCLIAAAVALPKLTRDPPAPEPTPPISDPGPGSVNGPVNGTDPAPVDLPDDVQPIFNQAPGLDEEKMAFCTFSEMLTAEERAAIIPDGLPDWLELRSAFALYYGWEEGTLNCVELSLVNPETGDRFEIRTCPPDQHPIDDELFLTPDASVTHIDDRDVVFFQYADVAWTAFSCSGVNYYLDGVAGEPGRTERLKEDFFQIVVDLIRSTTSPDLDRLQFHREQHVFQEKTLTPEEARLDPDFGAWYPAGEPEGLVREQVQRLQNSDHSINTLTAFWNGGYDYLTWSIRPMNEYDGQRIVSPEERERYDLTLYSIPLAQSVPEKYRETVTEPVFRAEELTEEMVRSRCVAGDGGEGRDAFSICFSVAFDNVVVDIRAKNVSPEWIYAQLDAMR